MAAPHPVLAWTKDPEYVLVVTLTIFIKIKRVSFHVLIITLAMWPSSSALPVIILVKIVPIKLIL